MSLTWRYVGRPVGSKRRVVGTVVAENRQAAMRMLFDRHQVNVISLRRPQEVGRSIEALLSRLSWWFDGLNLSKWRLLFWKQMSRYVRSSVPIDRALALVTATCKNRRLRFALSSIVADLADGDVGTLSEGIERHPDEFSHVHVAVVRAAEDGVGFVLALERLAYTEGQRAAITAKITRALLYPALVVLGIIGLLVFMSTVFIPQFSQIAGELGQKMPPAFIPFEIIGGFFGSVTGVVILIGAAVGLGGVFRVAMLNRGIRVSIEEFFFRIPFIGSMRRQMIISTFSRFFAAMYSANVPVDRAFRLSATTVNSDVYEAVLTECAERVGEVNNGGIAGLLERTGRFDPMYIAIVSAGQDSKSPADAMLEAAGEMDTDVNENLDAATSLIEPILIASLGLTAGYVLVATYGGLYSVIAATR